MSRVAMGRSSVRVRAWLAAGAAVGSWLRVGAVNSGVAE